MNLLQLINFPKGFSSSRLGLWDIILALLDELVRSSLLLMYLSWSWSWAKVNVLLLIESALELFIVINSLYCSATREDNSLLSDSNFLFFISSYLIFRFFIYYVCCNCSFILILFYWISSGILLRADSALFIDLISRLEDFNILLLELFLFKSRAKARSILIYWLSFFRKLLNDCSSFKVSYYSK